MNTLQVRRSPAETVTAPDPSWRGLYRAAGISAALFVVSVLAAIALVVVAPPPLNAYGATTGGGAPVLVYLSDQYMTAATAAQHTAFATAAEAFIAQNNITSAVGILAPVGILILSLVMLKGVFPKGIAYLGIVTGAVGMMSEALRPIIGPGYLVYGLLLPAWFLVVGWKIYRLARD